MITFEFLNAQRAAESLVALPTIQLVATLDGDWFELDYQKMTPKPLPENFYLQEAANFSPKAGVDGAVHFVESWGRPAKGALRGEKSRVSRSSLMDELATLAQFGRFATDWFESDGQLMPPDSVFKQIEESLSAFHPRLNVGGSEDNFPSPLDVSVAQWADDVLSERSVKVCDFCGKRFTKQRGRSTSGRYRTDDQTKFCSHSCANRAGNRRRRNQGRTT